MRGFEGMYRSVDERDPEFDPSHEERAALVAEALAAGLSIEEISQMLAEHDKQQALDSSSEYTEGVF